MVHVYSEAEKQRITANPLNRENCKHIRQITVWKFRDYERAEKALALADSKSRKELNSEFEKAKSIYLEARAKFDLYKAIFPDIVQ